MSDLLPSSQSGAVTRAQRYAETPVYDPSSRSRWDPLADFRAGTDQPIQRGLYDFMGAASEAADAGLERLQSLRQRDERGNLPAWGFDWNNPAPGGEFDWAGAIDETIGGVLDPLSIAAARERERWRDLRRGAMPDPARVSMAAQTIGGVVEALTAGVAGNAAFGPWGGALAGGTALEYATYDDLLASGVEMDDARTAALRDLPVTVASFVAPVAIPSFSKGMLRFVERGATGAAINAPLGIGQRVLLSDYLREQGYGPEVTDRYRWNDEYAIGADLIFGAVFGAAFGSRAPVRRARGRGEEAEEPAPQSPRDPSYYFDAQAGILALQRGVIEPTPEQIDAAMVLADDQHARIHTAPGVPLNMDADARHAEAMARVQEQAANGEEIDAGNWTPEDFSNFAPHPPHETDAAVADAFDQLAAQENIPPEVMAQLRQLQTVSRSGRVYAATPDSIRSAIEAQKAAEGLGPEDVYFSLGRDPFYSAVARVVETAKTQRATSSQWWATISKASGVKKEELEWLGLEEWLKAQEGPVSREDVLDFVRANGVRVEETVLGKPGIDPEVQRQLLPLIEEHDRLWAEMRAFEQMGAANLTEANNARLSEVRARLDEIAPELERLQQIEQDALVADSTRWSQYTLPGGENYRELLLRLPLPEGLPDGFEARQIAGGRWSVFGPQAMGGGEGRYGSGATRDEAITAFKGHGHTGGFKSSHFDQPNILAHVRFKERVDAEGRRTLFIEEVQSDWHQAGRERGYKGDAETRRIEAKLREAGLDQSVINTLKTSQSAPPATYETILNTLTREELAHLRAETGSQRVPDAPFKDNKWAALAMKRMIRWAAENGFEQIAWIRGQHAVERFRIETVVNEIQVEPTPDGAREIDMKIVSGGQGDFRVDANGIIQRASGSQSLSQAKGKPLAEVVGKELADRLMAATKKTVLRGQDLRVGGEGMRAFYDRILPNIANDLGKKYGARAGETVIDASRDADRSAAHAAYHAELHAKYGDGIRLKATPAELARLDGLDAGGTPYEPVRPETVHALPITPELRAAANEGLPLFSMSGARRHQASRRSELLSSLSKAFGGDVQKLLDAGYVDVVESARDIPSDWMIPRGVKAVHFRDRGTTYFNAANIKPHEVKGLILHEIGVHHGMQAMLGKRGFEAVLRQVDKMVADGHYLAEAARAHVEDHNTPEEHVREETLAYLIEWSPDLPIVKRVLASLRQWLVKTFGSTFGMNLTVEDLRALAIASLQRLARKAERESRAATPLDAFGRPDARAIEESELVQMASREGYQGSDTGEAAEWLRAKAMGLDLSEPARMQRAREMGFDVDTPLYHGTDRDVGSFDVARAGERLPSDYGPGVYLTPSPRTASSYASGLPINRDVPLGGDEGANVMPVFVRLKKPMRVNDSMFDDVSSEAAQRLAKRARQRRHDGIEVFDGGQHVETVVFDPRNIRSRFAAFAPGTEDSADLLASRGAGGLKDRIVETLENELAQGRLPLMKDIAAAIGIERNAVGAHLSRIRSGGRPDLAERLEAIEEELVALHVAREEERAGAVADAAERGLSQTQAASELGLPKSHVASIARRHGIQFRGKAGLPRARPDEVGDGWLAENLAGASFADIAKRHNVSRGTVAGEIRRARLRQGEAAPPPIETLRANPRPAEIAEATGLPEERVKKILERAAEQTESIAERKRTLLVRALEKVARDNGGVLPTRNFYSELAEASGYARASISPILTAIRRGEHGEALQRRVTAIDRGVTNRERDLILQYNDGDDYAQIADDLGYSDGGTVRTRLSQVRRKVKKAMASDALAALAEDLAITPDELIAFASGNRTKRGQPGTQERWEKIASIVESAVRSGGAPPSYAVLAARMRAAGYETTTANSIATGLSAIRSGREGVGKYLPRALIDRLRALPRPPHGSGPEALFSLAGVNAKTADPVSLLRAVQMEAQGADETQVWQATGWWRNPADHLWRFEIDDSEAAFVRVPTEIAPTQGDLASVLRFPELFLAYPELASLPVRIVIDPRKAGRGMFDEGKNKRIEIRAPDGPEAMNTLLHEVQHAIQAIEGFIRGGDPEDATNFVIEYLEARYIEEQRIWAKNGGEAAVKRLRFTDPAAYAQIEADITHAAKIRVYKNFGGEIESRIIERRRGFFDVGEPMAHMLTSEERKRIPPSASADRDLSSALDPLTGGTPFMIGARIVGLKSIASEPGSGLGYALGAPPGGADAVRGGRRSAAVRGRAGGEARDGEGDGPGTPEPPSRYSALSGPLGESYLDALTSLSPDGAPARGPSFRRINLPEPFLGSMDVLVNPRERDIFRMLSDQRRMRQEESVRWGVTEEGELFVWDGNQTTHGMVEGAGGEGGAVKFKAHGEINDPLEVQPTLRFARSATKEAEVYAKLDPVEQALADEPDLKVMTEEGEQLARAALEAAEAAEKAARELRPAFEAAMKCAIRHQGLVAAGAGARAIRDLAAGQAIGAAAALPLGYGLSMAAQAHADRIETAENYYRSRRRNLEADMRTDTQGYVRPAVEPFPSEAEAPEEEPWSPPEGDAGYDIGIEREPEDAPDDLN